MGLWVGQRLLRALRVQDASSLAEVALGVFLITVLARLPWCIGFLITVIIGSVGLGAVVLTRFGTQSPSVGARPTTGGGPIAPAPTEPPQPAAVELPAPMVPPAEPALPEPVVSEAPRVEVIEGSPEPEARQRA
jgi:hypothetical protein